MSRRRPRTPVYWPRMKVRGRRNRAKLAARIHTVTVIPYAVLVTADEVGRYRFEAVSRWVQGAHRVEFRTTRDGYGRVVSTHGARVVPTEPPERPANQWSLSFTPAKAEPGAFDRMLSIVQGREPTPHATG